MPNVQQAQKGGFQLVAFPKEFERNFWEDLDRRFTIILLVSLAVVYGLIIYLANTEYSTAEVEKEIRQKYLKKFYEAEFVTEPEPIAEEDATGPGIGEEEPKEEEAPKDERAQKDQGKRAEVKGPSAAERRAQARAAAQRRGQQRASMEQSIAGQGVFAELSAGGSGGTGAAVVDVLQGSGGGVGDLDNVLSGVGGLQTATSSSRRSRLGARNMGGGASGTAGIDDLIEGGVGQTGSKSISRRGNFSIKFEAGNVSGKGSKSTARSVDAIGTVVAQHQDAIESCYKKEARINPNLKGSLTVQFTIAASGKVSRIRILNSTLKSRKVESCVKRRVSRWRFKPIDRKEGDVTFRQKFIFST